MNNKIEIKTNKEIQKSYKPLMAALVIVFVVVFFTSFLWGRYPVSPITAFEIILDKLLNGIAFLINGIIGIFTKSIKLNLGLGIDFDPSELSVVWNIRFPRILTAGLVGAALSVAGAAFQGMFRNPMASPDLLGASTGAGFGAALAILLGGGYFAISISSFGFGLLAVFIAYTISKTSKMQVTVALLLAGMMVSSVFTSGTSFIKLIADTERELPAITYWLMGSLSSIKMEDLIFALVPITIGIIPIIILRWRINLLTISESEALSIGVDTKKLRLVVIICASLMTSGSVAVSGMIGWIGLVIPHFGRLLMGADFRRLIPCSALMGGSFLIIVDNLSRTLTTSEIPIGIITSLVGAPVFLWLIISGGEKDAD